MYVCMVIGEITCIGMVVGRGGDQITLSMLSPIVFRNKVYITSL